jgi:hypothetical protein
MEDKLAVGCHGYYHAATYLEGTATPPTQAAGGLSRLRTGTPFLADLHTSRTCRLLSPCVPTLRSICLYNVRGQFATVVMYIEPSERGAKDPHGSFARLRAALGSLLAAIYKVP